MIVKDFIVASTMIGCAFFNAQQVTYLDENWEVTTKDKMVFYREVEKKGNLTYIKDFYKSGKLQMQGYAVDPTIGVEVFDGEVIWYAESGSVQSLKTFKNGIQTGKSTDYDGSGRITSDIVYKEDGSYTGKLYTYEDLNFPTSNNSYSEYKDGMILKEITFSNSMTSGVRTETVYKDGYDQFVSKSYDANNKLIAQGEYKDGAYKGIFAEFYSQPLQLLMLKKYGKNDHIEEQHYFYRDGKLAQESIKKGKDGREITYDKEGSILGKLSYKLEDGYYIPFEGTEYVFLYGTTDLNSIRNYKNGVAIMERYYNEETKLIESENFYDENGGNLQKSVFYDPKTGLKKGDLLYKDNEPYEGLFYSSYREALYKDGRVVKTKNYGVEKYLISEVVLSNDGTKYNGKIFSEDQKVQATYVSDAQAEGFDAEVSQYENGKVVRTAVIKNSIFVDGKIVMHSLQGKVEFERKGDWRYSRTYDENNQLVEETRKRINDDRYDSGAFYITEDHLSNIY